MRVYKDLENLDIEKPVVTIGNFDGVHIGHQAIFKRLQAVAEKIKGETVVISFWPHPRKILYPEVKLNFLNSIDERIYYLDNIGIDHLILLPFDTNFSRLEYDEFVAKVLVEKISMRALIMGYNHHIGKAKRGDYNHLKECAKEYDFYIEQVGSSIVDGLAISSTLLRESILKGDVQTASKYLGYHFSLFGKVVGGDKIGKQLGYPTANIQPDSKDKIIPADGVYACRVFLREHWYDGMLSIGTKPTIPGVRDRVIEVNIFNFDENIYNEDIHVSLIEWIRPQEKFKSFPELKRQMDSDKQRALEILNDGKNLSNASGI